MFAINVYTENTFLVLIFFDGKLLDTLLEYYFTILEFF